MGSGSINSYHPYRILEYLCSIVKRENRRGPVAMEKKRCRFGLWSEIDKTNNNISVSPQ